MGGDGRQKTGDGLYDSQIHAVMKHFSGYLGTFAIDEINKIKPSKTSDSSAIVNLDTSKGKGTHWVALYISPLKSKTVEWFDPLADEPPSRFMKDVKQLVNRLDAPTYLKLKINRIKKQSEYTNTCGYHAMKFIVDRLDGKPFIDASGFSEVTKSENKIKKFKKYIHNKYPNFKYV